MRRKHFFLIGAAWLLCSVSACRQADSKATATAIAPEKTFTDGLVQADTAAVLRLVNDYMGYARQGEYGKAVIQEYKGKTQKQQNRQKAPQGKRLKKDPNFKIE